MPKEAKATTFRIDPTVQAGLVTLSRLLHRSLNQLVNEAVRDFVVRRSQELEVDLESTLEELRAYRRSDPNFERAIMAAIESEATATDDPAEGQVVTKVGPAQRNVLKLING